MCSTILYQVLVIFTFIFQYLTYDARFPTLLISDVVLNDGLFPFSVTISER